SSEFTPSARAIPSAVVAPGLERFLTSIPISCCRAEGQGDTPAPSPAEIESPITTKRSLFGPTIDGILRRENSTTGSMINSASNSDIVAILTPTHRRDDVVRFAAMNHNKNVTA